MKMQVFRVKSSIQSGTYCSIQLVSDFLVVHPDVGREDKKSDVTPKGVESSWLGGGFKDFFVFTRIPDEMIQF